jgi:predicted esterase
VSDSPDVRLEPIEVRRTALVALLGPEPGPAVREVWYVLHGQAMGARQILGMARSLDDGTRLLVAPEALNRHYIGPAVATNAPMGATWMTRAQREWDVADYVAYLDDVHERMRHRFAGPTAPVTVLGFSQGGAAAVRWVATGMLRPAHLIIWESSLPPEVDYRAMMARQPGLRVTYVCGTRDKFITPKVLDAQHRILADAGVPFEAIMFEGGHRLDDAVLRRVSRGG